MSQTLRAPVLVPGVATGIGSLPTTIPSPRPSSCCAACPISRRHRSCPRTTLAKGCSRSGWARSPRSRSRRAAPWSSTTTPTPRPCATSRPAVTPACVTFLDVAAAREKRPARVKVQVTGPLTLGVALQAAGVARPARVPARRRGHARVVGRDRGVGRRRRCPTRVWCSSSTSPRSCRGSGARNRSTASRRSTCCRVRSRRSTASPVCTSAAKATSRWRWRRGPRSSAWR